jgi:hypothetical protein
MDLRIFAPKNSTLRMLRCSSLWIAHLSVVAEDRANKNGGIFNVTDESRVDTCAVRAGLESCEVCDPLTVDGGWIESMDN